MQLLQLISEHSVCVIYIRLIHGIITSHILKLSSLCRDMNGNVKYRKKSPEKTTSISFTLKLLQCVWSSTGIN